MKKRYKFAGIGCLAVMFLLGAVAMYLILNYDRLDTGYQKAADVVRKKHAKEIRDLVMEYVDKSGHLPFEEESKGQRFMVLIGHSSRAEEDFAKEEVLDKGATFTNADALEAELTKVLGREIQLPRDPQKVATYAPNVYIYFLSGEQFSVVVHLFEASPKSVPYIWRGKTFHSHTLTYSRKSG